MVVENRQFEPTPPRSLVSDNSRVHVLWYGVVCVILRLAVLVQCRLATDGQTDRRTDGRTHDDSIYRHSIASRGNESIVYIHN